VGHRKGDRYIMELALGKKGIVKQLNSRYLIRPIQENDLEKVARLLSESFTNREPLTMAMKFSMEEHLPHAKSLVAIAIQDQFSFLCEDTIRGEIAGYVLSEDFSRVHDFSNPFSPKYPPIVGLLEELSQDFQRPCLAHPGVMIHLLMLGVAPSYLRQGIGTHLAIKTLEHSKALGFKIAVAEATATHSQKIFDDLGFRIKKEINYSEFSFDNSRPFSNIRDPLTATFVSKELVP
jgi:ribosomal protein S18 acetylase RimI-like enzyme